jgi:hypothetical protein
MTQFILNQGFDTMQMKSKRKDKNQSMIEKNNYAKTELFFNQTLKQRKLVCYCQLPFPISKRIKV